MFIFYILCRITFLLATKIYINQQKDMLAVNQRRLKLSLVITQSIILAISLTLVILMFAIDPDSDTSQVILDFQFYYVAWLFFIIMIIFCVVDFWLIQRLKSFYPSFYARQKK